MEDIALECRNVTHAISGNGILHAVNFSVQRGDFLAIVGPSGCGKSTLLKTMVGTLRPSVGAVFLEGERVTRPSRRCGIVFQHYSLYPFLTALENAAFGRILSSRSFVGDMLDRVIGGRQKRSERFDAAAAMLNRLGLNGCFDRFPHELSGGMRQRVALAQAMLMKPNVLVLDEPFGALDEATREELQDMLLELYSDNLQAKSEGGRAQFTLVIVTHELTEAVYVASRVIGLSRNWDFREAGFQRSPGASVVYDQRTCVSRGVRSRQSEALKRQKEEIRSSVYGAKVAIAQKLRETTA